ncbi:MAG: glycosyltransferase [Cytophagales bacterium]|nr:glycosyltransferase [Cytophagales bacterium]
MSKYKGRLLFYAPNVHTGGGFVLLQALLASWPKDTSFIAWLDVRAQGRLEIPANAEVEWVHSSVGSRLKSEFTLARKAILEDRIFCFHGLPPLVRSRASVLIFQQNRNYFGWVALKTFSWRTRQRLRFEQTIAHVFRARCKEYWVQGPSMARDLRRWYGEKPVSIRVLPFSQPTVPTTRSESAQWDFLYVADGEAHKNHRCLVEAWGLLAQQGIKPSLALTLSKRDAPLLAWIEKQIATHGLKICNLGQMPHDKLLSLYGQSKALIFPSVSESFGLPLVEARQASLPILASELDFVRDVCEPVQTFDPASPTSIARAVRRFIGQPDLPLNPVGAVEFLSALLGSLD